MSKKKPEAEEQPEAKPTPPERGAPGRRLKLFTLARPRQPRGEVGDRKHDERYVYDVDGERCFAQEEPQP